MDFFHWLLDWLSAALVLQEVGTPDPGAAWQLSLPADLEPLEYLHRQLISEN